MHNVRLIGLSALQFIASIVISGRSVVYSDLYHRKVSIYFLPQRGKQIDDMNIDILDHIMYRNKFAS